MSNKYQKAISKMAKDDMVHFHNLSYYSAKKCIIHMFNGFKDISIKKLYKSKNSK